MQQGNKFVTFAQMKITFLTPPEINVQLNAAERTAGCTRLVYDMPNIYVLTIAAIVEKMNVDVRYVDFVLNRKNFQDFETFAGQDKSHCYCFWSVNLSIETDLKALETIRKYNPNAYAFFMGPAPTYYTQKFLKNEKTFALRGEAETTIKELINAISNDLDYKGIRGISYLDSGKIVHNPPQPLLKNLDGLPFPARHFIEKYTFTNPKLKESPYTTIVTSRNCPFHCIYCVPSSLTFAREMEYKKETGKKPPVSFRSVENVAEELALLHAKGYKAIGIMDDNFIVSAKRLREIGAALKQYGFSWGCQARADVITDEIAEILQDTGCQYVDLGVESFNDEILAYIKKGLTSAQIYAAIASLKKYKVPVKINVLIGTSPLETAATIKDTLCKAKKLNVSQVMFNIVAPFPGTEFYEIAKANKWIVGGDYTPTDVQRNSILNYPNLSARQMERMLFWNNIQFFLRPRFIWHHISRFHSFSDFKMALKALKIKLFG
ncbi:MAG: B12-binding domain-containing radical SAM protein [Prevotellaceae bacterium]|nr:B12-binding domain-containing radical SAM protein [Prevotellaceae bacterium]